MRVLVIEDEKKIATFICKGLKEEGYSADMALDGREGLDLALENRYDLIILDIMLPSIDGFTILKELRKHKITTPVIILSVKNTVEEKISGLDLGANDYLTKPFAFEELLARIRVVLRNNNSVKTNYKIADLELDLLTHKVTRDSKDIVLSLKEYALLEYLMRNSGNIITRTMISEHVWDVHFDTDSNIIDVYINYLRNKIDKDHRVKLIHTVRGRGYVLKE